MLLRRAFSSAGAASLSQKIIARHLVPTESAVGIPVPGDFVLLAPKHVLTHDNTGAVMPKFLQFADRVHDPSQLVFALDHNVQDTSAGNLAKYERIKQFAQQHGVAFYGAGRGIGHQLMCENGFAWPGALVVASDSHANMYGGLGCLGTPVVRTDAAAIWATGHTWWQVPQLARVELRGALREGVTGKDVIITLCGLFPTEVLNHVVEFVGEGAASLSVEDRMSIANMSTEWGAAAGLFEADAKTKAWLTAQGHDASSVAHDRADVGSEYATELLLDLSTVGPSVAGPNHVNTLRSVSAVSKDKIMVQKAYIVSCVNSRPGDLQSAARVLKGKKVHPSVELYVSAASSKVQQESESSGHWQDIVAAGARVLPPGCGPCIGLGAGLLKDGEVGISATNRNFKGRMGSPKAQAYLASPSVVAASAVAGFITGDAEMGQEKTPSARVIKSGKNGACATTGTNKQLTRILRGFPKTISGRVLFCNSDNVNTDGIYPGKYTYNDDISAEQQAAVAMENYDARFQQLAQRGDVLVSGFNFGIGSSREQAATALKHRGMQVVVAGSFNETYKRNALNNGLLVLEVPEYVEHLRSVYGSDKSLTLVPGDSVELDFVHSTLKAGGRSYSFAPVGEVAQDLILHDGLENVLVKKLKKSKV